MPFVLSILRVLTLAFGLFFVYMAAFTYETTDKRIQNKLEDLWLRFADDARTNTEIAERFARVVLSLMAGIFDRVFGQSQLSIRTLSVASCYAYGLMAVSFIPLLSFLALVAEVSVEPFLNSLPMTTRGYVIVGVAVFAIGTLPAVLPSFRWVTYLVAFLIVAAVPVGVWAVMTGRVLSVAETQGRLIASLASVIPLPYGIGVIHATRHVVRNSVKRETTRRDLFLFGSLLMVAIVAFAALLSIAVIVRRPRGDLTIWLSSLLDRRDVFTLLFSFGGVISPWGAVLLIGVALSLVVLLHVSMWPAIRFSLMKTLYAAQRHELINRKKTLWSLGLGLVICAIAPPGNLLIRIIGAVR